MTFAEQNAVKDLQVILKEVGLYNGTIDGLWGKGTASGLMVLEVEGGQGVELTAIPSTQAMGIKTLQKNLKALGLYMGAVDGILGKGSLGGLNTLKDLYQRSHNLAALDIAWSKKVPSEFVKKVKDWAKAKNYFAQADSALMACMNFESAGTFSPSIISPVSKAVGLIQFLSPAASDLGTTLDALAKMSQLEQLDWVFKYFDMWERRGKKYTQLEDFYLTIFYPKAVGMKPDETLFLSGTTNYTQNRGFDLDKDGRISIGEISSKLRDSFYTGLLPTNRTTLKAT